MIRATLDPDKLYMFLRSISQGKEVESTLVNQQGQYQVVDPGRSMSPEAAIIFLLSPRRRGWRRSSIMINPC